MVAADKLGTLNHTCLTIEALRRRKIPISCVILSDVTQDGTERLNDPMWRTAPPVDASIGTNYDSLKRLPDMPPLVRLPFVQTLEDAALALRPAVKTLLELE